MSRCTEKFLDYEFDVKGHTHPVCKAKRKKVCPHYGGKCPAILENEQRTAI